jgi:hypothetical protein
MGEIKIMFGRSPWRKQAMFTPSPKRHKKRLLRPLYDALNEPKGQN